MNRGLFLGVDVGTGSVRAGLFDPAGRRHGMGASEIEMWRPAENFVQQSSNQIWRAAGIAIRSAVEEAGCDPADILGIGFDATCSLVVLGESDRPLAVGPPEQDSDDEQNVIVWMDHRAHAEADEINQMDTGTQQVLKYVGGRISPEMQIPKLRWLKTNRPETFAAASLFLDLPDYLSYRATGADTRSVCTTVCKWTYLGHEGEHGRWDADFFRAVGLEELVQEGFARIGTQVRPMGERAGRLTTTAADELGLPPGIPVAVSIIDAHAGGLGLLGAAAGGETEGGVVDTDTLTKRLALIGGTSSCHMAVSREPRPIDGVWGPYYSAMVPGLWLTEGGQSATGALIDHVIDSHVRGAELRQTAQSGSTTAYALLNERLDALRQGRSIELLTRGVHVLPYFHGNRSPRADASLRGMISGLRLDDSIDTLAIQYLATVQAIALGTRHILEALKVAGYEIDTILACGGDTKNPIFLDAHAQATGCAISLAHESEAVLLGAAILAAVAAGSHPDLLSAMKGMNSIRTTVRPDPGQQAFFDAKYEVFHRMHEDQQAYRDLMGYAPRP